MKHGNRRYSSRAYRSWVLGLGLSRSPLLSITHKSRKKKKHGYFDRRSTRCSWRGTVGRILGGLGIRRLEAGRPAGGLCPYAAVDLVSCTVLAVTACCRRQTTVPYRVAMLRCRPRFAAVAIGHACVSLSFGVKHAVVQRPSPQCQPTHGFVCRCHE